MGEHAIRAESDPERLRLFMQRVLDDLRALEQMLAEDRFETGVTRIGAEQEMFLVDERYGPAPKSTEVLAAIDDPHFTTELAKFNIEANLDPLPLEADCLSRLEAQLDHVLAQARAGAAQVGAKVLLTGILPTLDKSDLGRDNMTPVARYFALADAVRRLRGSEFELHIRGRDELTISHDSVMLEASNTSFQLHFQVDPASFARLYNIAQVLAAPTLAAATNSPLFFGKRLWRETRIAVFRQSVDTRSYLSHRRQQQPRVAFGEDWIDESVVEIFREDLSRFRLLLATEVDEDPFAVLSRNGEVPKLKALCLHNGTVYRWNRPCYGITDGKPHLRIENRVLPAGPSVIDEVANAALWLGSIKGLADELDDVREHLTFGAVRENFLAAARLGLRGQFRWLDERSLPAQELLTDELLPRARVGLRALGVDADDADRTLDIVEERVRRRRTGSQWMLGSLSAMNGHGSLPERLACLTAASLARQEEGTPGHTWPLASMQDLNLDKGLYSQVSSLMTTDLFTVHQDEVVDLVANLMDWKHIRHVPVEDDHHRVIGLVTHRNLMRTLAQRQDERQTIAVGEVMQRDVITIGPDTPTLEAITLMKQHGIACLPVVEDERLVGIVSERDFMQLAGALLESFLGDEPRSGEGD
ncbi:MAG: glutamate-cysteine ligase family protein [Acidobacteriota bacterium]